MASADTLVCICLSGLTVNAQNNVLSTDMKNKTILLIIISLKETMTLATIVLEEANDDSDGGGLFP